MNIWNIIICVLAIIGMASVACCIMIAWMFARSGEPNDERHRMEDEEQLEYLRKWKEQKEKKDDILQKRKRQI